MGEIQTQQTGAQAVKRPPAAGSSNRDAQVKRFLAEAMKYQGQPYQSGGGHSANPGPVGPVDCTGLVIQAALKAGVKIPPQSGEGYDAWSDALWSHWGKYRSVSKEDLKPGDICYFNNGEHVGIYMGKDPKTGEDILLNAECTNGVYARRSPWGIFGKFDGAVRLIPDEQPAGPATPRRDFPGHERRVSLLDAPPIDMTARAGGGGVGGVKPGPNPRAGGGGVGGVKTGMDPRAVGGGVGGVKTGMDPRYGGGGVGGVKTGMDPRYGGGGVGGVKTEVPPPARDQWVGALAYGSLY